MGNATRRSKSAFARLAGNESEKNISFLISLLEKEKLQADCRRYKKHTAKMEQGAGQGDKAFEGKTVIVTGAGAGLGRAISRAFARWCQCGGC
jgi:hypothetical protein